MNELYQKYAIGVPEPDSGLLRQLVTSYQPFSGARQPERSTMSVSSPYDNAAADIARQTIPEIASGMANIAAGFAPGSGEYLSAKQSVEDTAKAREAIARGDYVDASAQGLNAVVNAVGSLPIAHQIMAAGKAVLGGSHMLMAGAPFFSKLEHTINTKMGGKSSIDDLIRMAKNNGVSDAEINATIRGLEGTVTKQQALDTVRTKQPEFKDVLLGNGRNNLDALQRERQAIQDSISHGEVAPDTQAAKDKVKEIHNRYISGDLSLDGEKYYKLRNEAESEMERLFQRDYGDKYKRMDEIDRQIKNAYTDDTHFSEYTEPGAVEGSYREMFVTTPAKRETVVADNDSTSQRMFGKLYGELDANDQKIIDNYISEYQKPYEKVGARWYDGHSQYDDIENPVVRIRFNDRDVDGKKVLFVEEMQGPSNVSQDKMPEELRNRIYDIGTKRVLNYAKENGYDGVAWTKGDMQAQRYDLSKHVDNIDVNPKGGNREVSIYFKNDTDGYLQLDVDASGIVTATANKRGEPFVGKPIQEVVGKEVGGKIIQTVKRENLSGLDLQVGGEGLKSLYDKTLPSMFKKYGKEPVSTIELNPTKTTWGINGSSGMRFDDLEEAMMHARNVGSEVVPYETLSDVHYIPITEKTPDSFPQYGDGGLVTPEEQLKTMVFQPSDIDAYSEPTAPSQPDDTLEQLIRSRNEAEAAYVPPATEEVPVQQATKPIQRKQVSKPLDIRAMVTAAADKFKVPRWMAHGVASNESGYDTKAKSRVGATSVMQLMPATAKSLGVTNINDPRQNINAGVKYLRDLLTKYKGDYRLALAAYNAGPTNVAKYNGVPPFAETQAYVNKVLKHRNYKYGDGGSVDLDDNADFGNDDGYTPYDESEVSSLIDLVLHGDNGDIDQDTYEPLYKDEEDNQVNGREWRTPNISEGMPSLPSARIMKGALKLGDVNLGVNAQGRSRSGAENYRQQAFDVTLPVGQGSLQLGTSRYSDPYSSDTGKRAAYNTYLGSSQHSPSLNMMLEKYKSQKHPNFGVELSFPFGKGGKVSSDDILNKIEKLIRKGQYAVADMIGVKPETKFATEVSERYFPNEEHNERADAMRHMLFQAQLYKRSPLLSNAVGWAHENTALTQPDEERAMDEYNDVLGRGIAITSDDEPQTLVRKALEAIQSGKAKYMTPEENARLRRESAYADGGQVKSLQQMYEDAMLLTQPDYNSKMNEFMATKAPPFSGGRKFDSSTMGIATPQDQAFAQKFQEGFPKYAEEAGNLVASIAPGSGEYLSAKQSYDATDKAQKAIGEGNYAEAAAQGIDAVINAVGSIPIAHQIMALGKGAVGVAKGLIGAEHLIPAITTYHGSPTSGIRKWDLRFRGTGEGRLKAGDVGQDSFRDMIGHGLYSAEREGIAKGYQERLAKNNLKDLSEAFSQSFPGGEAIIDRIHYPNAKSLSEAVEKGYVDASKLPVPFRNALSKGSLYTTELTPHPDEFLLWDRPLSEQSEKVKAALKDNEHLLKRYADIDKRSHIYTRPIEQIKDMAGQELYENVMSANLGSDKAASEYLQSLGIRGIKYLDNPSRGAGEGTYNYVMFNPAEEAIITHENGQRIPGAVEEAYRKLRDPESKAILLERYPELKDLDKPLVNSQDNRIQKVKPWSTPQQEVSSASTSISYPDVEAKSPVIFKAFKNGKIDVGPINADIGGGRYDQITNWLQKQGVQNVVYDPFNRTMKHNQSAMEQLAGGKADTATVSNVLNVIPDAENRAVTIATAYDAIRPGGKAYFSMYAAPKAGEVKGRDAYQVGKKPSEYIPEIEAIFGEGAVHRQGDLIIATKRYPELKDLDKPLVNSLGNPILHAENFKNWYKDAELLDADKNPQVLFHSTKNVFDEFAPKYKDSMIFTTTNPEFASRWTYGSGGNRERTVGDLIDEELVKKAQAEWKKTVDWDRIKRETDAGDFAYFDEIIKLDPSRQLDRGWWHSSVMPVYVNAKKIFDPRKDYKKIEPMLENIEGLQDIIKNNMHKEGNWIVYERPEVTEWLQSNGYDGIRLAENVGGDHETIAVFNPKNIKSIYNRGTFDPNNPNILMGAAPLALTGLLGKYDKNDEKEGQNKDVKTPLAQKKTKGYANGGMVKEYNPKEIDEIANMVREGIYG